MGPARRLKAKWAGLTGTGAAASVSLGLLVFFCVFVAVAGPRDSLGVRTHALRSFLPISKAAHRSCNSSIEIPPDTNELG